MATEQASDDVSFGDGQGPVSYWGPGMPDDAPSVTRLRGRVKRLSATAASTDQSDLMFGDLSGPLAYWGPGASAEFAQRSQPKLERTVSLSA